MNDAHRPGALVAAARPLHVVHVVRQFHPSVGGMEEVVANIARRHIASGAGTAEVVTLDRLFRDAATPLPAIDEHLGIPIRRLPFSGSSRYPLCPSVLRAIHHADVVHVHAIDFFFDYLAATRPLHRRPMIVSTHGGFFHTAYASRLKSVWFDTITRASSRAYARVVATSENDGALFSRVVSPQRLRVIENGVDVDKFAGLGSREPGKTLIYFGRWSSNKGLLEALDLVQALGARDEAWRLIIAGRAFDLSRDDLDAAITARGLGDRVDVVASPSQHQLGEAIARAHYFVCLSRHEGFGIAAIEAMSAGLTPVLSDIPPFAKLVSSSGIGTLVDKSDAVASAGLVQALAELDEASFADRRANAIAYAQRHDWHAVCARYEEEYRAASATDARARA